MMLINRCQSIYGKTYGVLLILANLYVISTMLIVVATSDMSGLIVFPLGFITLMVLQLFIQSAPVNLAIGSFGMFTSIGLLIALSLAYHHSVPLKGHSTTFWQPLIFFLLLGAASGIVAFSVFFRQESDPA